MQILCHNVHYSPPFWVDHVNEALTELELLAVRQSVQGGLRAGDASWTKRTVAKLGLETTLRPRGSSTKPAADGEGQQSGGGRSGYANSAWFRVSLRTALVVVTLLCVLLAVKAKQIRDQKQAVDAIRAAGGRIYFDDQLDPDSCAPVNATWARRWLNKYVGSDYVAKVSLVTLYPTKDSTADEQVEMLAGIPYLRNLAIWPGARGKSTADSNAPGGLTDDGLRYIAANLPNLRHLSLTASTATTEGLEYLVKLDRFESLQVDEFQHKPIDGMDEFVKRNPQLNKD